MSFCHYQPKATYLWISTKSRSTGHPILFVNSNSFKTCYVMRLPTEYTMNHAQYQFRRWIDNRQRMCVRLTSFSQASSFRNIIYMSVHVVGCGVFCFVHVCWVWTDQSRQLKTNRKRPGTNWRICVPILVLVPANRLPIKKRWPL